MFCPRCGRDNPQAAKYCNECGLAFSQIQSVLLNQEGPVGRPDRETARPVPVIAQPVVPEKKENLKKHYVRTTTPLPVDAGPAAGPQPVSIPSVPSKESITIPVSEQRSGSVLPVAVPEPVPVLSPVQIRNPALAAAFSIVPGLGQVYNGMLVRGIVLFMGTIIGLFVLIIPGVCVWIYAIYDAYRTSGRINRGEIKFPPGTPTQLLPLIHS